MQLGIIRQYVSCNRKEKHTNQVIARIVCHLLFFICNYVNLRIQRLLPLRFRNHAQIGHSL